MARRHGGTEGAEVWSIMALETRCAGRYVWARQRWVTERQGAKIRGTNQRASVSAWWICVQCSVLIDTSNCLFGGWPWHHYYWGTVQYLSCLLLLLVLAPHVLFELNNQQSICNVILIVSLLSPSQQCSL